MERNETMNMPVLALRGLAIFPGYMLSFDVEREISIRALERAMEQVERYDTLSPQELKQLKRALSHEGMFHIKWLGDRWVPGFAGEGPGNPWWNYLDHIAKICQDNL